MIARKGKENNYVGPILQVKHREKGEILLFNGKKKIIGLLLQQNNHSRTYIKNINLLQK